MESGIIYTAKAGAVALLLSQNPAYSNMMIKRRLCETAWDLGLASRRQGFGRIDIGRFIGEG